MQVVELHGDMNQPQRLETLRCFSSGDKKYNIMLATDLAARGLDFPLVDMIINFDLVSDPSKYVHRVGRTARAGHSGECINLYDDDELLAFKKMGRKIVRGKGQKLKIEYLKVDFDKVKSKQFLISKMKNKVKNALKGEWVQRQLLKAEMEAEKAQNMIDHAGEIMSRPKREWIVSNKEKQEIKDSYKKVKRY